tara:strand:- start:2265 stop:2705 length:441 start_codon:yes stop_codon:yes gene_type:complete
MFSVFFYSFSFYSLFFFLVTLLPFEPSERFGHLSGLGVHGSSIDDGCLSVGEYIGAGGEGSGKGSEGGGEAWKPLTRDRLPGGVRARATRRHLVTTGDAGGDGDLDGGGAPVIYASARLFTRSRFLRSIDLARIRAPSIRLRVIDC